MQPRPPAPSPYAAVFIDFENVYYFLKNHFADPPDLNDYVLELVRRLRDTLLERGLDCLVINAYADFERLPSAPQGGLYLAGVLTRNVLGTDHKNAADMQLCIDALEVHYTRPEISTFVLVAGDRDYIPLLRHLRRCNDVAQRAVTLGHHPFGAILVAPDHETVLLEQCNIDTVNHAESTLARVAATNYPPDYLWDCTLYTSVEPCCMCAGTAYWANIGRVVFGLTEQMLLQATGSHEENPTMSVPARS